MSGKLHIIKNIITGPTWEAIKLIKWFNQLFKINVGHISDEDVNWCIHMNNVYFVK